MKSILVKLSEIGSTQYDIRNFILYGYNNWDIRPEYLLLVGAPNYIPFPTVGSTYSDNYYTDLEGDFYNDILSGRLTVHSQSEAENVINKTLLYERFPDCSDPDWFKKACLIVNIDHDPPDDSIYWSDAHYAAGLMVQNGFVSIDTLSDQYGHHSGHVETSVNQGVGIVMYRGQGLNNWCAPFNMNPDALQNGVKMPIVLSTTCRTMGTGSTPATAERWLLTGTVGQPKGAVGFFPTTTTVSNQAYLRSAVAKGFNSGLFEQGLNTFGQSCEAGRDKVYRMYPYQGGQREYFGFTTLGDPELNIWTATPQPITVAHEEFAAYSYDQIDITVTDSANGGPIRNLVVCLSGHLDSSVYEVDTTDILGNVQIDVYPLIIDDTIHATVTGRNIKPYEGYLIVKMMSYCYMRYLSSSIVDSVGGNGDGYINPTEDIIMPLWVENIGESTGVSIQGVLRTSDPYTTITDSIKSFGDIPGEDSAYTGANGFAFTVAHSCPDQNSIDFELEITDVNDSTWYGNFTHYVRSPHFRFDGAITQGGNNNNVIEPGETLDIVITLTNIGSAPADSVHTKLLSIDQDITMLDSIAEYGSIPQDSSVTNQGDPFTMAVDSMTPIGTILSFTMPLTSNYMDDTLTFNMVVGERSYYLWNPDPSPASGENIHAILTNLGYIGDYGTTLPTDLSLYRSLFVCLGVYSNRYLIEVNDPEAIQITDFLNAGRRVYLEGSSAWYVDPEFFNGHDFGPLFGIYSSMWSHGTMGPITGMANTFTQGMYFQYGGENAYMDHLNATGGAYTIFVDDYPYYCAVANDQGSYRTVGTDFELGLLIDASPPSTRVALLDSIMKFFGVMNPGVAEHDENHTPVPGLCLSLIGPNPCRNRCTFTVSGILPSAQATISIYDISGRNVYSQDLIAHSGYTRCQWEGIDNQGNKLPGGVYFIQCSSDSEVRSQKIIFLR